MNLLTVEKENLGNKTKVEIGNEGVVVIENNGLEQVNTGEEMNYRNE